MVEVPWAVAVILVIVTTAALSFLRRTFSGSPLAYDQMEIQGQVLVYSIIGCPHCMRAKNTLQELGLPFVDVSLDMFPQCREEIFRKTGRRTVPQIFFNEVHVGGNDDLTRLVEDKKRLQQLIDNVKCNPAPPGSPLLPDPSTAVKDDGMDDNIWICEADEYALLVKEFKKSGLIGTHRKGLKTYKNSFSGCSFVDWVVKTKGLDRHQGVEMGQELISQHYGHEVKDEKGFVDGEVYYKLLDDDENMALNAGDMSLCRPRPVPELGEEIRKLILKIYAAFLSKDGKKVNYKGIAASSEFKHYEQLTKELQRAEVDSATVEEKLAFFINIYNALVIHANVKVGTPVNIWQRFKNIKYPNAGTTEGDWFVVGINYTRPAGCWYAGSARSQFFNTVRYLIGGYNYSLQEIENGVLRANRKGVGMMWKPFSKSDARLKVALEEPEPLIHFALVCGAKSCPPIKTYSSDQIYLQLKLAAQSFLEGDDGCQVNEPKGQIKLSQIFKWYREDFGKTTNCVVQWVIGCLPDGEKRATLIRMSMNKKLKVSYLPYDWKLNSD